jgi:hypothetical protein
MLEHKCWCLRKKFEKDFTKFFKGEKLLGVHI